MTSLPYRSPDGSFEGTLCEDRLCAFIGGMSDLILSQNLYGTLTCFITKKAGNVTFYIMGPLRL